MAVSLLSADIHPDLTEYVLKLLMKNKITTVLDFAKTDTDRLIRITNLSFEEISAIKSNLINSYSGNNIQVVEYFRYLNELIEPISTGIRGLDLLLEGGLLPGQVLEVCGESGSGKSQLCTSLAINIAQKQKLDVFYCDTKSDFSARRVHRILTLRNCTNQEIQETMKRVKVERIFSPEILIECMENILDQIDNLETLKVIIIDSLPALWYMHQNSKSNCYPLGMLTRLVGLLRKLSSESLIAIVVVNLQVRSSDYLAQNSTRRTIHSKGVTTYPALGKFWETAPTTRILLSKLNNSSTGYERLLSIWKCNYLRTGDRQMITITEGGTV
ncbi:DNA repair protein RAD51 homolog 4 [Topomyia yanbarensis]|uniref:DNA repair protein RAD51 homolog 4 n=1 Tax=Topomyia yanbarensis TaxID=2498891 RepID=UPI00273B1941|nr:DNA repair protein RAD51 homolog 4 [Topomyia yanbarensis]